MSLRCCRYGGGVLGHSGKASGFASPISPLSCLFVNKRSPPPSPTYVVQRHEKETIRKDPVMKARVVASYELMLDFYGLKLTDREKGTVEREDNWVDRFHNLNTRYAVERPTLLPQETNTRPHFGGHVRAFHFLPPQRSQLPAHHAHSQVPRRNGARALQAPASGALHPGGVRHQEAQPSCQLVPRLLGANAEGEEAEQSQQN